VQGNGRPTEWSARCREWQLVQLALAWGLSQGCAASRKRITSLQAGRVRRKSRGSVGICATRSNRAWCEGRHEIRALSQRLACSNSRGEFYLGDISKADADLLSRTAPRRTRAGPTASGPRPSRRCRRSAPDLQLVARPTELLRRLAALVPPPRHHLVRFHGVFAPNASWRSEVVPHSPGLEEQPEVEQGLAAAAEAPTATEPGAPEGKKQARAARASRGPSCCSGCSARTCSPATAAEGAAWCWLSLPRGAEGHPRASRPCLPPARRWPRLGSARRSSSSPSETPDRPPRCFPALAHLCLALSPVQARARSVR
jgi:hypothetical protein